MTIVQAKVRLTPKFRTYEFDDDWEFEINGFSFHKDEDANLYVSFQFEYEVERDDPDFGRVIVTLHI